jgi:predicted nucleic acid-binding protein
MILDSTPLIYLTKIGRLDLLLSEEILIPRAVYEEVVTKGLEEGFLDAKIIQDTVEKKAIKVRELGPRQKKEAKELMKFAEIEIGEAEAIVLAKDQKAELLMDDAVGNGVAKALNVIALWTTSFILKLVSEQHLQKGEAREIIKQLVEAGYRINEEVLVELLEKLK